MEFGGAADDHTKKKCKFCEQSIDQKRHAVISLPCGCFYHLLCRNESNLRRQCYEHTNPQDALVDLNDLTTLRVSLQRGKFLLDSDHACTQWNDTLELVSRDLQQLATFASIQATIVESDTDTALKSYPTPNLAERWFALDLETRTRVDLRFAESLQDLIAESASAADIRARIPNIGIREFIQQGIRLRSLVKSGYQIGDLIVLRCTWRELLSLKPTVADVHALGTENVINMLRYDKLAASHVGMSLFNSHFFEGLCRNSLQFLLELRLSTAELQLLNVTIDNLQMLRGFQLAIHLPAFQVDMKTWKSHLLLTQAHLVSNTISQCTIRNRWHWVVDQSHIAAFEKVFNISWGSLQKMTMLEEHEHTTFTREQLLAVAYETL